MSVFKTTSKKFFYTFFDLNDKGEVVFDDKQLEGQWSQIMSSTSVNFNEVDVGLFTQISVVSEFDVLLNAITMTDPFTCVVNLEQKKQFFVSKAGFITPNKTILLRDLEKNVLCNFALEAICCVIYRGVRYEKV